MLPVVKVEDIIAILNSSNDDEDIVMGIALYNNLKTETEDNGLTKYYTAKPYVMLQLSNKDINPNAKWEQGIKDSVLVLKRTVKNKQYVIEL